MISPSGIVRADLLAIIDYISDDNRPAAQRLKDDIEAKAMKLPERPKLYGAGRVAGTREMVVRHHENIRRLLTGQEFKIGQKRS